MFEGFFDIKNDRRLSMYLYRCGFGFWLLYLLAGAPVLASLSGYRNDLGVLSAVLIISGFSAAMVFDYIHHRELYRQKKKWLFASYIFLTIVIYFLETDASETTVLWRQLLSWFR